MGTQTLAAVVLDVDGTLVDSERDGHRVAFNRAFEEAGLAHRWGEERYGELLAVSGGQRRLRHYLLEEGYDEDRAEELAATLHARKTEIFQGMVADGEIPPRPGVTRLLDELADAGIPVAIATTGSRAWVEPLLDDLFGLERFVAVVTGDDVERRKPDAEAFELVLDQLREPAERTVVIEDSGNGVIAAAAAGLPCLVVVNDYTRHDDGLERAALVVDRFGDPGRARVLTGPGDLLVDGAVRVDTLARLAAGG